MSQLNDALEEVIFVKIHVYKENAGYSEVRVIELEERGFKGVFLRERVHVTPASESPGDACPSQTVGPTAGQQHQNLGVGGGTREACLSERPAWLGTLVAEAPREGETLLFTTSFSRNFQVLTSLFIDIWVQQNKEKPPKLSCTFFEESSDCH